MENRDEAINKIRSLMRQYAINIDEISTPPTSVPSEPLKSGSNIRKFFAFLGGVFILCGLSVYISQHWMAMNGAARIIITLGVGIAIYIFTVVASFDGRYESILTPFYVLAASFETIGMSVAIDEWCRYQQGWHETGMIVFGVMLIQQLVTLLAFKRTSLVFLAMLFGVAFFSITFDYFKLSGNDAEITLGLSLMIISYALDKSKHRDITPFWYFIGSMIFLSGLFSVVENSSLELIFLAMTVLIVYMSTIVRSRSLLFSGTLALIFYIGYFTNKHFANSIGWPLSLVLFGVLLIAISMMAIKIGKTIK